MPVDNHFTGRSLARSRARAPTPPKPLAACVEGGQVGSLHFRRGTFSVVNGNLVISWFGAPEYLAGWKAMKDSQTVRSQPSMRLRPSIANR